MRTTRQLRHEPDPHRARRGQVRAERAAEQHLRDLLRLDPEVAAEQRPAGGDRRLRELELAHVALREEHVVAEAEDVLLADLVEPVRRAEDEAAGLVEDPGADELRDRVDEPGAADARPARRRRSPSARSRRRGSSRLRSRRRPRACRSGSAPPRTPGPRARRVASVRADEPSTISEFVPTSMKSRTRRSSVSPVARIPATMSGPTYAPSAGNSTAGARSCTRSPKSVACAAGMRPRRDRERRHRQRLRIDPERDLDHRHVAGDDDLVDLGRIDAGFLADFVGELLQRLVRARLQQRQRLVVHHRRRDPRDHVGAERLLPVQDRLDRLRQTRSRGRAASRRRSSCRGRTRSRTAPPTCRPARRRSACRRRRRRSPSSRTRAASCRACARRRAERAARGRPSPRARARDRTPDPRARLLQLEVALLHRRTQDHVPPDSHERRLRPRLQRRHLDGEVFLRGRAAREPPAGLHLLDGERARVDRAQRRVTRRRRAPCTSCRCRGRRRSSRSRRRSSSPRRRSSCRRARAPP